MPSERGAEVGTLNRRGLKWAVAGTAGLVLIILGAHLTWERQRCRLDTPQGTVRVGMTRAEVEAVLGPPYNHVLSGGFKKPLVIGGWWELKEGRATVSYDQDGRADGAAFRPTGATATVIPRPSLVAHLRSWLTGKRGE